MLRLLAPRPVVLCRRCRLSAVAAAAAAPPWKQQRPHVLLLLPQVSLLQPQVSLLQPQVSLLQLQQRRLYAGSLVDGLRAWVSQGPEAASTAVEAPPPPPTTAAPPPLGADDAGSSFFVQDAPASLQELLEGPVSSVAEELLASAAEPTFASLGLGTGLWPTSIPLKLLETMHVTLDMPWWLSAIVLGICVRLVILLPNMYVQRVMRADLPKLRIVRDASERMRFFSKTGNTLECIRLQQLVLEQMPDITSESKLRQFKRRIMVTGIGYSFTMLFVQMGSIRALYRATALPVESFQQDGILWLTDLTSIDPYFLMPAAITGLLLLNLGYYFRTATVVNEHLLIVKPLVYTLLPVFVFTCLLNFPGANLYYFLATGTTAQLLNLVNTTEAGKEFWKARIGLPRVEEVLPPPSPHAIKVTERIRNEIMPAMNNRNYQTTRMADRPGDAQVPKTYRIRHGQLPLQRHKKMGGEA